MTSRREFLQIGIATASALPLAAQAARAATFGAPTEAPAPPVPLYKVVYDARFPHGAAFARRVSELGVPVHAIKGDMTRFWYEDIYHVWKQGPVAIAGLTAHGPLFCFEQLAMDRRMRVVFRAEHRSGNEDFVEHRFSGPATMVGEASDAGRDWSGRMADVVTRCPSGRCEIATATARTSGLARVADGESLYSWVIAPAGPNWNTA